MFFLFQIEDFSHRVEQVEEIAETNFSQIPSQESQKDYLGGNWNAGQWCD